MSDYPSRLRSMADFSLPTQNVTKLLPAAEAFLRETAAHVERLEYKVKSAKEWARLQIEHPGCFPDAKALLGMLEKDGG